MYEWEKLLEKEILNGEEKRALCYELLTEEPDMERMILKFFTEEDLKEIASRRIGRGQVGGKACGLLLSRKLIEVRMPAYHSFLSAQIPLRNILRSTDAVCCRSFASQRREAGF